MKITAYLIAFALAIPGFSSQSDSTNLWNSARAAYENGNYEEAYNHWQEWNEINSEANPDLFYNLGNAAFKSDKIGQAILNWNKALKLNPEMEDAQVNLAQAKMRVVDNIVPAKVSPITEFSRTLWLYYSPLTWGILACLSFALMALSFAIFKFSNRSISGLFMPLAFVLMVGGLLLTAAGVRHQYHLDHNLTAVVVQPNIYVKSAPMTSGADAFILHEGTEMKVVKSVGDWYEIKLADGKVGWVQDGQVGVY